MTFPLGGQQELQWLYRRLHAHGLFPFFASLRKDWREDYGDLIVRVKTSTLHHVFEEEVGASIQSELQRLRAANPSLRPTLEKIEPGGHVEVA